MTGYNVKIRETSKELSKKERVMMKDTSDAQKLDEILELGSITIKPSAYAILDVHNEKSDNKDYPLYLVTDDKGDKYITGSESFWASFSEIWDEMTSDESQEEWSLKVYKLDSKNYKGKRFITCSIV